MPAHDPSTHLAKGLTHRLSLCDHIRLCNCRATQSQDTNGGSTTRRAAGARTLPCGRNDYREKGMHYIKIAGAATLTGVGLGCLATDAVLRQRSGEDLTLVARTLRAPSA